MEGRRSVISVAELTQKLFADAKKVGISSTEIEEDTGSPHLAVGHDLQAATSSTLYPVESKRQYSVP
ncbi:DUF768 domain-containing protein [Mesorhizobium sp. B2-5-7]|nr:DUF768 domain-containing protein [Mesorhizobium sp. B2-5-7]